VNPNKSTTVNPQLSGIPAPRILMQPANILDKIYYFYKVTSKTKLQCTKVHQLPINPPAGAITEMVIMITVKNN
jgi:hypothetical protein